MTDDDVPFVWGVEDKYRHSQTKRLILFVKLRRSFAYMSLCEMNCKQLRKRPLFFERDKRMQSKRFAPFYLFQNTENQII